MASFVFPADRFRFYHVNVGDIVRFGMVKCCDEDSDFEM